MLQLAGANRLRATVFTIVTDSTEISMDWYKQLKCYTGLIHFGVRL